MLTSLIVRIIDFCTRHAWLVIVVGLVLAVASGVFGARHFAINSDINALLSSDLGWRKRELAFEQAFSRFERIIVVVEAPTPELASAATAALTQALAKHKDRFRAVTQPGGGEFFARNGLLFLPPEELKRNLAQLVQAEPLINDLATDLSLRGLISGLEDVLLGIQSKRLKLDDVARVFTMASDTMDKVIGPSRRVFPGASWPRVTPPSQTICAASSRCGRSSTMPRSNPATPRPTRSARRPRRLPQNSRPACGSPDRWRWRTRNSPPSRKAPCATASSRSPSCCSSCGWRCARRG